MASASDLSAPLVTSSALRDATNRRRVANDPTNAPDQRHDRVQHVPVLVNGIITDVKLTENTISFKHTSLNNTNSSLLLTNETSIQNSMNLFSTCLPGIWSPSSLPSSIPFADILSIERVRQASSPSKLTIFTFSKQSLSKPNEWYPCSIHLESENEELMESILQEIQSGIVANSKTRPRSLLVLINPNAGSGAAKSHYTSIVQPVFARAGISIERYVETERAGHAYDIVRELVEQERNDETRHIDGIVAVGGDGIFHEVMNGVLLASSLSTKLRLCHIPCGSTDAVACSLYGCRSVFTAAMHCALGDSTPLDALRVRIGSTIRYSCCIATYGFMGNVVKESEHHRWLGPFRYDIIGALKILENQSYKCRVTFRPSPPSSPSQQDIVCTGSSCLVCKHASTVDLRHNTASFPEYQVIEGEFMSIMLIVHPCRSDKTPYGMARFGHLANGRFTLVLVRKCSPLNYLRFLTVMSSSGLIPGQLPGLVDMVDAVECRVSSVGEEPISCWNVDGEIVHGTEMEAHAHLGAVQCFARGLE